MYICIFRYFVDITLKAQCVEWTLALATLLLDGGIITRVVDCLEGGAESQGDTVGRVLQGLESMSTWATSEW